MSEDVERLILFFMEDDHPHTIGQIAMSLEIGEEPLRRMLLRLQSMGYLHIAPLCPVIDIVVPGHKLTRM
ncbi:MAG: hypothetical protein QCI38_00920, partial [Candidatus Thermoplasmatota archaeon]|nr:hypothetical protein [Candidatus Thermoplasmatota archaeon]